MPRPESSRMTTGRLTLFAGLCGVIAAISWIAGDILIIGTTVDPAEYPLLFITYADRIETDFALHMISLPASRLMAGALIAALTVPLYLVASWHLWQGVKTAGKKWAIPAITLIFTGFALSPLPHASFYFLGAAYQALLATDHAAHPYLLGMAADFHTVLLATYLPSVLCSVLGLFWLSAAIATGASVWPRWFAVAVNPLTLALITIGGPLLLSDPLRSWLGSASFNVSWLLIYTLSVVLLWRARYRHVSP